MRYFTREIWDGIQAGGEAARPWHDLWDRRVQEYWTQYAGIRARLSAAARTFFDRPRLHDGRVLGVRIRDGVGTRTRPTAVTIEVEHPEEPRIYTLAYGGVFSVNIVTPAGDDLVHGFDDWGYDEITSAGDGLRHEILFASGLEISIVFHRIRISSRRDSKAVARQRGVPKGQ